MEAFQQGLGDTAEPEVALAALALTANSHIHELSHINVEQAGMGTTLTALYVGEEEVSIAHVGDSRAYCLRDGELLRLTDDHSLVDELIRQGRLTPEEAIEHPQRSVITRALGPEGTVEIDTRSYRARHGDVYLLCSDGLTTMVGEDVLAAELLAHPRLRDAGEALVRDANEAGGRDNITVLLLRLEELRPGEPQPARGEHPTLTGVPALAPTVRPRSPRRPSSPNGSTQASGGSLRRAAVLASVLVALAVLASGVYLGLQSIYFVGTNSRGLMTLYQGVPYQLPAGLKLYSSQYVSGVSASTLTPARRRMLLDHSLRSESSAGELIRSLELEQVSQ